MHMNVKSIFLFFGTVFSIIIITGCFSVRHCVKSDYVLKTKEQLVEQLRSEYPDCFVSCGEPITVQDASKLVGEWELLEAQFCQFENSQGYNGLERFWTHYTYQFFADGTFSETRKDHRGISGIFHGIWSYENELLQIRHLKDGVFQRMGAPYKIIWYSESIIELRNSDFHMTANDRKIRNPTTIYHSQHYEYATNGCQISEFDFTTEDGLRVKNIGVLTPNIMKRIGKAVKPSDVGMQSLITNDTGAQPVVDTGTQQENLQDVVLMQNIVQGINAFSSNMSQINNHPPVPVKPTYTPQTKVYTPPAKPTYTPKPIPQYQRIPRASSFGRSGNLPSTDWNTRQNTGLQRVR